MAKSRSWTFKARFRAKAYGRRGTALASKRLKEAVSEIKKAAKSDAVLAADGAVSLMERLWPSLESIDTSSGTLGNAVHRTLDALIPLLVEAPADMKTRAKWLERLYEAVLEDGVEYLMPVEERWGEICVFPELANHWANRLMSAVRDGWSRAGRQVWVVGATICLSSLFVAGRYDELNSLLALQRSTFWHFGQFGAMALARQYHVDEAKHLLNGRGYEPTERDLLDAYSYLIESAAKCGLTEWANRQVEELKAGGAAPGAEPMLRALAAQVRRAKVDV